MWARVALARDKLLVSPATLCFGDGTTTMADKCIPLLLLQTAAAMTATDHRRQVSIALRVNHQQFLVLYRSRQVQVRKCTLLTGQIRRHCAPDFLCEGLVSLRVDNTQLMAVINGCAFAVWATLRPTSSPSATLAP